MANAEHLAILRQGVEVWNKWREENERVIPDLIDADLRGTDLNGANLDKANLTWANLIGTNFTAISLRDAYLIWANLSSIEWVNANLQGANLSESDLSSANLSKADLSAANLIRTNLGDVALRGGNLYGAVLHGAYLGEADLRQANLTNSNLYEATLAQANLIGANLSGANLTDADFTNTICSNTNFSNINLSVAKNLSLVNHFGPSTLGIDTLVKSEGKIPIEFLEGCGVPKHIIGNMPYIVDIPAIQYYSCFISHSTKDAIFVQQLNDHMKREGLRVWYSKDEMRGGKKIHEQIEDAIRYYDKVILVLSDASMTSAWVETEIKNAREQERETKRRKLFPISLVQFEKIKKWKLFDADEGRDLAREIRDYYIPDFSKWKDYDAFSQEFEKLLRDLRAEE